MAVRAHSNPRINDVKGFVFTCLWCLYGVYVWGCGVLCVGVFCVYGVCVVWYVVWCVYVVCVIYVCGVCGVLRRKKRVSDPRSWGYKQP